MDESDIDRGDTVSGVADVAPAEGFCREGRLRVALVSIAHGPSLATRNLRRYCLAHEDVRRKLDFTLIDSHYTKFLKTSLASVHRMSFSTSADRILASLVDLRPSVVGFSCYLWNSELSIRLATQVKRLMPAVQVVLGGPDVGARAETLLLHHDELDVIVDGDGEIPFLEMMRRHLAGRAASMETVPQVIYRRGGNIVRNRMPDQPTDLSLLTNVWDDLPTVDGMKRWGFRWVPYETMRGCPYPCSFCTYGKTPASEKPVDVVVAELSAILARGLDVVLIDPTFTTYSRRAKAILRGLGDHTYTGTIWFEAFPDSIDEEVADLLPRANVKTVSLGFQTLSPDGLKAVGRPQSLPRFERAVRLLKSAGVAFWVDIIYGLPNTTVADFLRTVDYLNSVGASNLTIYRLLGLPSSPMLNDVDKYGLVFSPTPPYELLASQTYTIGDLIWCERFTEVYCFLYGHMAPTLFESFARMLGGFSAFVRFAMDSGLRPGDDLEKLGQLLEGLMRGEGRATRPVILGPAEQVLPR